jgi:D-alanyl-D-alanine carboxypeptidase
VGEKFTLEQLWNIALIGSSNTAISALVRESGTSTRGFAELMNAKARDLKLSSLSFAEPTGLSEYNVGSSLDIARLLKSALSKEKITKALSLSEYDIVFGPQRSRKVWNTDWLLTRWIPLGTSISNVVGKTGYIGDSGYNFAARLTSVDDHSIRVVVLGTQSNEARFTEVRDLAEWVFNSYKWPN